MSRRARYRDEVRGLVILNEDNRRLFGEQVNDHIEKLNDLMGFASGERFKEQTIRRASLSTRLLEGSTRMLDLADWSRTLKAFRDLMERSATAGRCWDEQLATLVSEILEIEEQIVAEILAGELEELGRHEQFDGLLKEIECLTNEQQESVEETLTIAPESSSAKRPADDRAAEREHVPTFTRLMDSLATVRDMFQEFIDKPSRGDKSVRDLEVAFGESEFYMGLAAETVRMVGKSTKPFTARISCDAVLDGLKDFFGAYLKLRRWNARLATRCADCTLDRENATALAAVLMRCIFDICKRNEVRDDLSLAIGVDIRAEGSFLVAKIQDNAPDFLCDSEIDRDDAGAFYQCFREIRSRIEDLGSLLWIEPGGAGDGRFMFTLPRANGRIDYRICNASGKKIAVPAHAIDTTVGMDLVEQGRDSGGRSVTVGGVRIPVYALEEIAVVDEFESSGRADRVLVAGRAERRFGLLVDGAGRTVDCVAEQVTEGAWASLSTSTLNIGEEEFPIIDANLVLRITSSLRGIEGGPEEAGTYEDGGQGNDSEVTVPRVHS